MEFSRQEYWSGSPLPSPGDLPDPGLEPGPPASPALQADSSPRSLQGSPFETALPLVQLAKVKTGREGIMPWLSIEIPTSEVQTLTFLLCDPRLLNLSLPKMGVMIELKEEFED